MINIGNIENKLNNLQEGKYRKSLNNKTYDIEVKNIDENNKSIKVYECNKLIIDFIYYKNGKVIKGESNMNEIITLNKLIEKLSTLKEGFAKQNNMSVEVMETKNDPYLKEIKIEDETYKYCFDINDTNEYSLDIDLKEKYGNTWIFTKITTNKPNELNNRCVGFRVEDKLYSIKNNEINSQAIDKNYPIYNNTIMNKIDEKNYIGYNLENDKVYLYTKRNDNESVDFDKDYLKVPYSNNLSKATEVGNTILDVFKNKIKDTIKVTEINDLIDNVKIPKINNEYDKHVEEVTKVAKLYKEYVKYFNMLDDQNLINNLYNFVNSVNITILRKKANDFKENVNNNDMSDLETLYNLKKQLKEIIKLKKRENKPNILSLINKKNVSK